jgi:hypothetical protein
MTKSDVLLSMEAFLTNLAVEGRRALLVVDEAQNLTAQAIEELRMLSNYQLETRALLQSFLVGQPEFRRMLESAQMQQLRQRVIAGCHISPMDAEETRGYIEHRLSHVGWNGDPEFDVEAYQALFEATGGIPRRINSLCDRLLLSGYLNGKHAFAREDVEEAAREIRNETRMDAEAMHAAHAPTNGAASPTVTELGSVNAALLDVSTLQLDPAVANKASQLLTQLEVSHFEERLARLERDTAATMNMLRQLLDAVRTQGSVKE